MKIAIAGGSGFVGTALIDELSKENHDIYILTRHPEKFKKQTNLTYIGWLTEEAKPEKHLEGLDVFINLAGESLNSGRWTPERKRRIVESRVEASKEMNRIISILPDKVSVIINASAVGYYGISDDETFTETSESIGDDFLARTVQLWEKEAAKSRSYSKRLVLNKIRGDSWRKRWRTANDGPSPINYSAEERWAKGISGFPGFISMTWSVQSSFA